jgi:galactokinase
MTQIRSIFYRQFATEPIVIQSPGRINIIGEHTDYNEGFVLPASIDKSIYVAISKREDQQIHLFSSNYQEYIEIALADIRPNQNWSTYILGVVDQVQKKGHHLSGFNLVLDGDVPIGAGLSSSAAVECAVVFALNELFGLGISKLEMVQIAQKAEHTFSGVLCGIMDMFASMFGQQNQVIKLDCRSLDYTYKPLVLDGYKLVLFNTNVKHSLASSAYNTRRQECEQGVNWVQQKYPEVKSLRDVNKQMLEELLAPRDQLVYRRCNYVVSEIERLQQACDDLERGDLFALGQKMFQTHQGLSKDYEVSCKELDFLVDEVKTQKAVLGARVMGGGFGGCTLNLVKEEFIAEISEKLYHSYQQKMGLELSTYIVTTAPGTHRL